MAALASFCAARVTPAAAALTSDTGTAASSSSAPLRSTWRICPGLDQLRACSLPAIPAPRASVRCVAASAAEVPTVAATKSAFLNGYRKPIPSIYSNVIQDLLVQQHLMRYNSTYQYDPVFALGYVTVYDQLMDGYPNAQDRDAIFRAYISALKEDPEQYRIDAKKLEEWASAQTSASLVAFAEQEGEIAASLKDISERASSKGTFHYSRFFAIGLFRLLEVAKASDPAVLEQLCRALNVSKISVDRDLDVYRNLLSKLVQGKELLKEYIDREKKKQAEREAEKAEKASAAVAPAEVKTEVKAEVTAEVKSE